MTRNKINLEEIIKSETSINTTSIEMYENGVFDKADVLKSMKEACRQTLELAAQNAEMKFVTYKGYSGLIEKEESVGQEVNIEDKTYIQIDKQSILDTINLIES